MKQYYKLNALILCVSLLLAGCTTAVAPSANDIQAAPAIKEVQTSSYSDTPSQSSASGNGTIVDGKVVDGSITDKWETKGLFAPEKATTTTIDTYKICEGTEVENEITVLTAKVDGPTIFIIAGQHGDEVAGYTAINKLKNMELKKGKVYILSPANLPGSKAEPKTRFVIGDEDLNRSYPGKKDGTKTELLAAAIYDEIEKIKPVLVLDHHEARTVKTDKDFLGSSLIYTSLDDIEDLFMNMHQATQNRELCAGPFNFYGPGPTGSINNVVAANLKIPVITVETYRGYVLERRVEEHMAIVGYVLSFYEMV